MIVSLNVLYMLSEHNRHLGSRDNQYHTRFQVGEGGGILSFFKSKPKVAWMDLVPFSQSVVTISNLLGLLELGIVRKVPIHRTNPMLHIRLEVQAALHWKTLPTMKTTSCELENAEARGKKWLTWSEHQKLREWKILSAQLTTLPTFLYWNYWQPVMGSSSQRARPLGLEWSRWDVLRAGEVALAVECLCGVQAEAAVAPVHMYLATDILDCARNFYKNSSFFTGKPSR